MAYSRRRIDLNRQIAENRFKTVVGLRWLYEKIDNKKPKINEHTNKEENDSK